MKYIICFALMMAGIAYGSDHHNDIEKASNHNKISVESQDNVFVTTMENAIEREKECCRDIFRTCCNPCVWLVIGVTAVVILILAAVIVPVVGYNTHWFGTTNSTPYCPYGYRLGSTGCYLY